MPLLSSSLMAKLARLTWRDTNRGPGRNAGQRRTARRGQSQEFADHRPYSPGDDIRFLDWHLAGRLDSLWVKLFEAEEDRVVWCLLDSSQSMEGEKIEMARQVAAGLATIALGQGDRCGVAGLTDVLGALLPPRRGRQATAPVFQTLEAVLVSGGTDLAQAITKLPRSHGQSLAVLFSDLLTPQGLVPALRALKGRGFDVVVFHTLSAAELDPDLDGDFVLVDVETGAELEVAMDALAIEQYQQGLREWSDEMKATCQRFGADYVVMRTDQTVEDFFLRGLRAKGWLKRK